MEVLVKNSVRFKAFHWPVIYMIGQLESAGDHIQKNMVITSANDSKHREGSLHYQDLALDIRIRHLNKSEIDPLMDFLNSKLNNGRKRYDVILESDHIHLGYDPE